MLIRLHQNLLYDLKFLNQLLMPEISPIRNGIFINPQYLGCLINYQVVIKKQLILGLILLKFYERLYSLLLKFYSIIKFLKL